MAILGNSGKPGNHWHSYSGSSKPSQEAEKLTPPRRIRVTDLGAWIGGWDGTCRVCLTIWRLSDRAVIAQTAEIVVPNEGAGGPSGSNVQQIVAPLVTPLEIGEPFYCGFVRHDNDGHQISMGSDSSGQHIEGNPGSAYPTQALANSTMLARRIGVWAIYEDVSGANVYRGGAFTRADVTVSRGDVDTVAERVAVYRNGAWVDGG